GTQVHTLPETGTLADAVALLNANNIGAVVITGAQSAIAGILSERDIVRRLRTDAASALALPIAQCMTRGVMTSERSTPIAEIMERMTRHRIRHMPVAENGALISII
ncbi:MAG: CBS domain-containing protein, partial [Candidatus Devosia euplotis]|nr:CBS domain-containing protein [Candidatus Devosia euplotis]